MKFTSAVIVAAIAALAQSSPLVLSQYIDKCLPLGQGKGTITKANASPLIFPNGKHLNCGFDLSSSVTWVMNNNKTRDALKSAKKLGRTYSDGVYTGQVYHADVSWSRPIGSSNEKSYASYIDPSKESIDFVVTDSKLPYGSSCYIGLLPSGKTDTAQGWTSHLHATGKTNNMQVLYFDGDFVQWGSSSMSTYAWQSLQTTNAKENFNWQATLPAVRQNDGLAVDATVIEPSIGNPVYKAIFNATNPITYVPKALADKAWAAYNVTSTLQDTDGSYIYTWNCNSLTFDATRGLRFIFSLGKAGGQTYKLKESAWTISDNDNNLCEGFLRGSDSLTDIRFGSATLSGSTGLLFDYDKNKLSLGELPGYDDFGNDPRSACFE